MADEITINRPVPGELRGQEEKIIQLGRDARRNLRDIENSRFSAVVFKKGASQEQIQAAVGAMKEIQKQVLAWFDDATLSFAQIEKEYSTLFSQHESILSQGGRKGILKDMDSIRYFAIRENGALQAARELSAAIKDEDPLKKAAEKFLKHTHTKKLRNVQLTKNINAYDAIKDDIQAILDGPVYITDPSYMARTLGNLKATMQDYHVQMEIGYEAMDLFGQLFPMLEEKVARDTSRQASLNMPAVSSNKGIGFV